MSTLFPLEIIKDMILLLTEEMVSRVQIKTGILEKEFVTANACSMLTTGKRKSYSGSIDLFGIYCPQLNTFYIDPNIRYTR